MNTSNFNLRGIPIEVLTLLKKEAKEKHTSINSLILNFIEDGVGFSGKVKRTLHHDLDSLSGTWAKEECKEFENDIKAFEKVDPELWL
jgi:hypothetical protein